MAKSFPKTIYVKREKADADTEYFVADGDADALLEPGDRIAIATYKLVEVKAGWLTAVFGARRASR